MRFHARHKRTKHTVGATGQGRVGSMIRYAILEAPSNLGLRPTGVENSATTLLELELGRRLGARYAGRVEAPTYDTVRDPRTRMLNVESIAHYAVALANALEPILKQGEFPVVLGGDCSILLGSMLALRRRGFTSMSKMWTRSSRKRPNSALPVKVR